MKLLDEWGMSEWAYIECLYGNDTFEIRKLITESRWAYMYCKYVSDIEEMWSKITDKKDAYSYCKYVRDRIEVHRQYEWYVI